MVYEDNIFLFLSYILSWGKEKGRKRNWENYEETKKKNTYTYILQPLLIHDENKSFKLVGLYKNEKTDENC